MSDSDSDTKATPPAPVTRRRFLAHVAAAAAAPGLAALAADAAFGADAHAHAHAATHGAAKHAPPAAPAATAVDAPGFPRPDYAVAKSPAERAALEKQWKQMVELVESLRKVPVPVGSEYATGALAPRRLRREAN